MGGFGALQLGSFAPQVGRRALGFEFGVSKSSYLGFGFGVWVWEFWGFKRGFNKNSVKGFY